MTTTGKLWTPSGLESLEWTRGQGTTEKGEAYEAQTIDAALALYQALKVSSDRVRLQRIGNSPAYRVVSYHGSDQDEPEADTIVDTHELIGNVLQQPISLNPVLHELLTDLQINYVVQLANRVKSDKVSVSGAYSAISSSTDPAFPGTSDGDARNLLDQIIQGQTSFTAFQWVYRRTVNIASGRAFTLNGSNMGCIFESTGDLLSMENISLPGDFGLPEGEWLKVNPNQTKQYGQRTQVQYEYWWAEKISRNLYRIAS